MLFDGGQVSPFNQSERELANVESGLVLVLVHPTNLFMNRFAFPWV